MLFRLLLLTIMIALVYALAAVLLIRLVTRRFRKGADASGGSRPLQLIVFSTAIVGLACMAWGFWIEPFWPEITRVAVTSTTLPENADPIRIIQLSDTHSDSESRLEPSIPELVARLEPNIIVFTGDALNERGGLHHFQGMMAELAQLAPTFAVLGNWDVWYWGDLVKMSRFGDYYDMGLHRVEDSWLYVHRDIGMEGGQAPRARFLCRPEIAVIELTHDGG